MNSLGYLLANHLDPPDLDSARRWYEQAAAQGNTDAMHNLGVLLANRLDPPDLDSARRWFQRAADAGNMRAAANLKATRKFRFHIRRAFRRNGGG